MRIVITLLKHSMIIQCKNMREVVGIICLLDETQCTYAADREEKAIYIRGDLYCVLHTLTESDYIEPIILR